MSLFGQKARQVNSSDFETFDFCWRCPEKTSLNCDAWATSGITEKFVCFWTLRAILPIREVADPYYGDEQGFENVLDLIEIGSRALADYIESVRS